MNKVDRNKSKKQIALEREYLRKLDKQVYLLCLVMRNTLHRCTSPASELAEREALDRAVGFLCVLHERKQAYDAERERIEANLLTQINGLPLGRKIEKKLFQMLHNITFANE